jgi:hypothetical protein
VGFIHPVNLDSPGANYKRLFDSLSTRVRPQSPGDIRESRPESPQNAPIESRIDPVDNAPQGPGRGLCKRRRVPSRRSYLWTLWAGLDSTGADRAGELAECRRVGTADHRALQLAEHRPNPPSLDQLLPRARLPDIPCPAHDRVVLPRATHGYAASPIERPGVRSLRPCSANSASRRGP